jgi:hypothetical protein
MFLGLLRMHKQYVREEEAFEATQATGTTTLARQNRVVVFVDQYDLATERALHYVSTLNAYSVKAVHFDIDPAVTRELETMWGREGSASVGVTLQVVECQDRRVDRAALELVADVVRDPYVFCMVILPRRGFNSRLQRFLHDRTADAIATAITHIPRTAATIIPYRMSPTATIKAGDQHSERLSDEVERGARRDDAHLEADIKLDERRAQTTVQDIGEIQQRDVVALAGRVSSVTIDSGDSRAVRYTLQDATGSVTLVFQGRESIPGVERGTRLLVRGTVSTQNREAVILNPGYEIVAPPAGHE